MAKLMPPQSSTNLIALLLHPLVQQPIQDLADLDLVDGTPEEIAQRNATRRAARQGSQGSLDHHLVCLCHLIHA